MRCIAIVLLSLCAAGCVSGAGRFSVLDIDLRDASRIEAGRFEAAVPYACDADNFAAPECVEIRVMPAGWWERVLSVLGVIRGRVRFIVVEWER